VIESYGFGRIVVNGRTYTSDVLIFPDHVEDGWWREEGHRLSVRDLKRVLEARPEVLIVGTGELGMMRVPEETAEFVRSEGIELVVKPTGKAVELYNEFSKTRRVVAAMHLTC